MSLSLYNQKRNFKKTSEPEGKEKSSKDHLRFVVQKHDASSVHYDFRLEMEGVLKSWAVPKGPSLNPADKRLAMMVEDHPYNYRNFEGVIPQGQYGGGTVIVWDEGTYQPANTEGLSRKEQEEKLLQQLKAGKINFVLHGKKLQGEFTLFNMKGRGEKSWMLIKKKDEHSCTEDITLNEVSVKSGKTLVEVALDHGTTVNHPEAHDGKKKTTTQNKIIAKPIKLLKQDDAPAKTSSRKSLPQKLTPKLKSLLGEYADKAQPTAMPHKIIPMLATLIDEPFDDKNWLYEIKWDGYRAVAYCDGKEVELISRNLKPFTEKYAPVAKALSQLKLKAVFDGEIVAVDENGLADFQRLQNWQNNPVRLQIFIFDILWINGFDITQFPLIERKRILQKLLPQEHDIIKYSDHVVEKGKDFFKVALSQGLEGIMAKKANSIYVVDSRTADWVKIKVNLRQEVIIAGYTQPRRTRKFFGSLLLGVYDENDELVYVGHTGSGFNTKTLEEIYNKLQPLKISYAPFQHPPKTNMPATWVKPELVCEIKFTEWTADRMARHPIFMGLRSDKKPKGVRFEKATTMAKIKKAATKKTTTKKTASKKSSAKPRQKRSATKTKTSGKQVDLAGEKDQTVLLDGQAVSLTNLDKIYWPKEDFRKGDMINYYLQMAPYMLPYLLNRPHSLNRHPNGIAAPNFFQKDVAGKVPDWIETFKEFSESTNETVEYLVCSNEATLIYMANLGCIEINPWHTRIQSPLQPDWCLIDLDPDKNNSFDEVIEVAQTVKKVLDAIGAEGGVKTSGSSGIHIYIPLGAKYSYNQSKQLAELIVTLVNAELPDLTSLERTPSKRKGKIYLDFLQNAETQTAAAPYSLRPKPGVPVSTPLDWSEVKKGLTITTWNAYNIYDRVKSEGDLFAPVLGKGIDLEKVLEKVQGMVNSQ